MSDSSPDEKTSNTLGVHSGGTDSASAQTISVGPDSVSKSPTVLRMNDESLSRALATLPNYEIQNKLGEGGMGAVYKARQRTLNRTVAIKVLPQHLCDNTQYVARLNREAIVLARINHANVITCFDLGEHQGMRYVVMEFVEGESLSRLIDKRKHIPQAEALYYIKQAVLGLDCANALGIIHRDIKPDNMLLAKALSAGTTVKMPSGYMLKIADLGLATFTSEQTENTRLTTEGSTLGSPHYMSPEQTVGESDVDFRTDIYALGITLFHMLTGDVPYDAPTIGAVLAKKLTESIKDPRESRPELSPAVSLLIHKMTARKRDDRYATYGELLQDIEAIEQNLPLSAEILPDERASLILSADTVKALSASGKFIPLRNPAKDARATASGDRQASSGSSGVKAALAAVAVVLVAGFGVFLSMSGKSSAPPVTASGVLKHDTKPDASAAPKTAPEVPKATVLPPPQPAFASAQRLIQDRSIDGWQYKGDSKDFGFQDGGLFLQSLKGWNRAEHPLPGSEFSFRGFLQTPTGVDDGEVQICLDEKTYLAIGIRLPLEAKSVTAYVERREVAGDKVLEILAKREGLSVDDWQDLKVNVWERQATCFVDGKFLVSAEISDTAAKCQSLRLAVQNGIIQCRNLEVSPRPATK